MSCGSDPILTQLALTSHTLQLIARIKKSEQRIAELEVRR